MTNVIKLGKKTFTWSVVVLTIVWSMGVAALLPTVVSAATCPSLEAGDLFKVPGNSAVYLLNANMERMYFPHSTVYQTWYSDFSGVVEIPTTCVDAYPAPSSAPFGVNFRPGSKLVKVQISPSVYVVEPGNKKSKVGSEAVATALYGSNWASKVMDVADVFWPNYSSTGAELTEAMPHNGMLVKVAGGSTFFVKDGMRYMVEGTPRGDVQTVSQAVLDTVALGTGSVTAASIYADPAQGAGGGAVVVVPGAAVGTLTVALASDTPAGVTVLKSQARASFTKVNFTATGGDVLVTGLKIRRGGYAAIDGDFSTVNVVTPEGNLLNEAGKTLNADHLASFTEDFTIPSGMTKSYMLVADMAAFTSGGNAPSLDLYSLETASTVVGSLPLVGNVVSTNASVVLGTATVSEGSLIGTVTKQVGSTNVNLADLSITVATQDFQVERLTLYNSGTTSAADVGNIKLTYNSNTVATGVWDGKYLNFDLASCGADCKILKGNTKNFSVYGDVISGSSRTIDLDVKRASHLLAKELNSNVYVTPTDNATAMTNNITISQGKLNVTKVNNVPAGNVPTNANGVELGSWNFNVTGESIDVTTLVFKITTTGTVVPTGFDSLALYNAAGTVLISGVDGSGAASPGYATSTDTITLPVGDNILTLKGNIDNTPAQSDTVTVGIDMTNTSNFVATGVDSGDTITLADYATPQSVVSANTRTITTAALRVTTLSTPPATTFAPGTSGVVFAKVQLDATGSSEDVKVSQFKVLDSTSATAKTIDIQNIRLWVDKDGDMNDGDNAVEMLAAVNSGSSSTAGADETFTYNLSGLDQFVVKAGKRVVVEVRGDIAGGATAGSHNFAVSSSNFVTATGVNTNSTIAETIDTATGNLMTVGTAGGQVQVSLDSSNPSAKLFAAGTQGVTLAAFNFLATTTENVEMEWIQFTNSLATASSSYLDYSLLYLENASGVMLGSVTPTSTAPVMDFAAGKFIVDKANSAGQVVYLKANLSAIGASENVTVGGHQLGFNIAAAGDLKGKGVSTGSDSVEFLGSTAPTANTHLMYKALPTVTRLTVGGTLTNGTVDLFKFKVTANTGDIDLYKFTFDITTTTVLVTNVELIDVTEDTEVQLYTSSQLNSVGYVEATLNNTDPGSSGGMAKTVSMSTPRTYVLRGTISGASSGDSVSTRMGGDSANHVQAAGALMTTATLVDADVNDDFIWSDRSASAHATTTADWVNGYLVSGLNSASSTPTVVAL